MVKEFWQEAALQGKFSLRKFIVIITVFSGLQVAPEYKPHPLFLPKIWEKFIDKSHLSVSRTLFCYFLACRNVLRCIHVMRRLAKERQDAIDAWSIKPRWSRYHYCHLGARAACLARDFRWEFSHALPVRAVDGRHVLQCSWLPLEWDTTHTEREREKDGGRGRGGHTAAETVSDCEVLSVSWSWSSADRGTP